MFYVFVNMYLFVYHCYLVFLMV